MTCENRLKIVKYTETGSTNDEARLLAEEGAPHGTLVLAEKQTAGRGRLGRSFYSPRGGLYMSLLLRCGLSRGKLLRLTALSAVLLCREIEALWARQGAEGGRAARPPLEIKWVNDVYCGGRKAAGILCEAVFPNAVRGAHAASGAEQTPEASFCVVGIGVNCSTEEMPFPRELGENIASIEISGEEEREELARRVAEGILDFCADRTDWRGIIEEYRERNFLKGKEVELRAYTPGASGPASGAETAAPQKKARVVDIDEEAGLVVEYTDGARETVRSGEVSVRAV